MHPSRGFEEVPVIACGVQEGTDRTGLSRIYNLYFVAHVDQIYVYQPQYPNQLLPERPNLILTLPVSQPGLVGYLSPTDPHGVNNLIVEDLGEEEILACACDDGDVIAYYTKHVEDALRRNNAPDNVGELTGTDVGAFFVRNVRSSAWGLAVHKEARILAVGANTHLITVFKFALADKEELDPGRIDPSNSCERWVNFRTNEHTFDLRGHHANIPCVAFCNTPEDPSGRWLMSVDISGITSLWDLELGASVAGISEASDSHDYAWGLLCLDKRSFRQTLSLKEAFGGTPEHNFIDMWPPPYGRYQPHFDISRSRENVKDTSPFSWHFKTGWLHEPSGFGGWMWYGDMLLMHSAEENLEDDGGSAVDSVDEEVDSDSDDPGLRDPNTIIQGAPGFPTVHEITRMAHQHLHMMADSEAFTGPLPTFPFIHISSLDVFLTSDFRGSEARTVMHDPLAQKLPIGLGSLWYLRRMNMFAQIPEIGVVIIASQVGRVGVFSLTRPPNIDVFAHYAAEENATLPRPRLPKYAMRLDWILPFRSQEKERYRPEAPLLGIAVGVVQGTEKMGVGEKRWRLMITYVDLTVMSYEIGGRRRGTPEVVV